MDKVAFKIKKQAELAPKRVEPTALPVPAKAEEADKTTLDPMPAPADSPNKPRRVKRRAGFVRNW
jgi:hypothetical protein